MKDEVSEKKINLDGYLYDDEGNFKPLASSDGNIYGKVAHLRNVYMTAEKEYFETILADRSMFEYFKALLEEDTEYLYECAVKIQESIENGTLEDENERRKMQTMTPQARDAYHMYKLEIAEAKLCLILAAIRDKAKMRELVREMSNDRSHQR